MKFLNRFYIICVMFLCVSLVSCENDGNSLDGESIKSLSKKLVECGIVRIKNGPKMDMRILSLMIRRKNTLWLLI